MAVIEKLDLFKKYINYDHAKVTNNPSISVKLWRKLLVYKELILQGAVNNKLLGENRTGRMLHNSRCRLLKWIYIEKYIDKINIELDIMNRAINNNGRGGVR